MPRNRVNAAIRKRLQPVHRRFAGLLPMAVRRHYLFLSGHGRPLRLRRPRTFTEKVNWRIVHDRRPALAWTCDKLSMKEYARGHDLPLRVPETLWSGRDLVEVAGRSFDRPWILKPNHRSGLVHFGRADEAVDARLVRSTRGWLADDQGVLLGEWAYSQARRLFVIEEDIAGGEPVDDYKFFVFHGEVGVIQVDSGRFGGHRRTLYSPAWEPLPVSQTLPRGTPTPAPENFGDMLRAAEVLGRPFDFMRIDLYNVRGTVWFGEVTPYPAGGVRPYEPHEFDTWLGSLWTLPDLDPELRP